MQLRSWKRTFLSSVAVTAIAAASLVGTSATAIAAPMGAPQAIAAEIAPQTVENLGLTVRQAKGVQRRLKETGYDPGTIDGYLGTNSWKASQRAHRAQGRYSGPIDGIVGPETIKAEQRALKQFWGYTGAIDGIAGPGTKAAFARYADWCVALYGY
ncbi:peptidoglycan-binding domain-containing protein [Streptomyces bacillaris]|uniref:peptidoglycan-binding domain-containing protein n=1 Tax=Streptomyces bacillaris TaxID=68179 RepID=UPI00345F3FEB